MEHNDLLIEENNIKRTIDYLKEESYLYDVEIEDEDYFSFFEIIYNCFSNYNLEKSFYSTMKKFIMISIPFMEKVNVKYLCESLKQLFDNDKISRYSFSNIDCMKSCVSKTKVLTDIN
jgi:hypothetical protein